jgi:hypothetical protein
MGNALIGRRRSSTVLEPPMRPLELAADRLLNLVRAGPVIGREVTEARFESGKQAFLDSVRTDHTRR